MTTPETALAPVEMKDYSVKWWDPRDMGEAMEMAKMVAASNLVPKDYRGNPGNVLVAWSLGAPMRLNLLQCLRCMMVINGIPQLYGDGPLAVCQGSSRWSDIKETLENEDTPEMVAVCTVYKKGESPATRKFSVQDAKVAKLWGKAGPWTNFPKRMLQLRARAFALRDKFADALSGIGIHEELVDITDQVTVRDAEPEGATATERLKNKLKGSAKPEQPEPEPTQEPEAPATEEAQELGIYERIESATTIKALNEAARMINQDWGCKQISSEERSKLLALIQQREEDMKHKRAK
jgi:hypothetical protein